MNMQTNIKSYNPVVNHDQSLRVNRGSLTNALATVKRLVSRSTMPILNNVKLVSNQSGLYVTVNNLDIEICAIVPLDYIGHLSITCDCLKLFKLLSKARKSEYVKLHVVDDVLTIDTGLTQFSVDTRPVEDFSILDPEGFYHGFEMDGSAFRSIIASVAGAMPTEAARHYLNGIFVTLQGCQDIDFVATDGHRLYKQTIGAPLSTLQQRVSNDLVTDMPPAIVPSEVVNLFLAMTNAKKNIPDSVKIEINKRFVRLVMGNIAIVAKLVDGTYPDYKRVIPEHKESVSFDRQALIDAVVDVSLIADKGSSVALQFRQNDALVSCNYKGKVADTTLAGTTNNMAIIHDRVGFEPISFANDLLIAALKTAAGEIVTLGSSCDFLTNPMLIHGEKAGWLGVLMPKRQ